jgi:ubiquinone/menaquinone biosynthesis C-methylase UbiE
MLSEARKKTRNAKVQLVQSQLDALPIASSQFDVGIASLVLSHLEFLGPPLGEMARVLTIGATLLVTDVHWQFKERGWQRTFRPRSSSSKRIAPESHYHSLTDYQNAFAQSGFTIDTLSEPAIDPSLRNYFDRSNMIQVYDRYLGKPLLVFFEVTKR